MQNYTKKIKTAGRESHSNILLSVIGARDDIKEYL